MQVHLNSAPSTSKDEIDDFRDCTRFMIFEAFQPRDGNNTKTLFIGEHVGYGSISDCAPQVQGLFLVPYNAPTSLAVTSCACAWFLSFFFLTPAGLIASFIFAPFVLGRFAADLASLPCAFFLRCLTSSSSDSPSVPPTPADALSPSLSEASPSSPARFRFPLPVVVEGLRSSGFLVTRPDFLRLGLAPESRSGLDAGDSSMLERRAGIGRKGSLLKQTE